MAGNTWLCVSIVLFLLIERVKYVEMKKKMAYLIFLMFTVFLMMEAAGCTKAHTLESLENADIDVVYKYIDLSDDTLHRPGIRACKKDYQNGELKYSLRSVIQNIPWVRKIFIIMPNDKVSFLKDTSKISNKIIYVKDKDLLGFDSASSISFEFSLWRLKRFGCSEHIIYMNDDYFIGKPLQKSDFFYEENGKVVPYVLYNKKIGTKQYSEVFRNYYDLMERTKRSADAHNRDGFQYQRMATFMFLYKIFGHRDNIIQAPSETLFYFPHNALGENLSELKEIYDLVKDKYKYPKECLWAKSRNNKALQHQTLYAFYAINKYKRKIGKMSGTYIDLAKTQNADFSDTLYCINTGGDKSYREMDYAKARVTMESLFPRRTKYEIPDVEEGVYTIVSELDRNKCLDIQKASREDGANLQLYQRNGTNAQKFYVTYHNEGYYTMRSLCSGKLLDVCGGSKMSGANIRQYSENDTNAQRWYIIPDGRGSFNIVSKCNNLCVDVCKGKTDNGTNIQCYKVNGTNAQKFKFIKCD